MRKILPAIPLMISFLVGSVACSSNPSPTFMATAEEDPQAGAALKTGFVSPTPTPAPPGGLTGQVWKPKCPTGMTMVSLAEYGPDRNGEFTKQFRCEKQVECKSPQFANETSSAGVSSKFVDAGKKRYTFWLNCNVTNIYPEG